MSSTGLRVLVLAGGPGRERAVSLLGGEQVARALREAGHEVIERDVLPDDLSALDEFEKWGGDVVFPVLHGLWGEGGGLQRVLSDRDLFYVGSGPGASSLCINKHLTKLTVAEHGVATPASQLLLEGQARSLEAPVVIKALEEGSTFGLSICKTQAQADAACELLSKDYPRLLAERYVPGKELTVGVIATDPDGEGGGGAPGAPGETPGKTPGKNPGAGEDPGAGAGSAPGVRVVALPVIQIIPAGECYDYDAKYERDDTQFLFDIDLPDETLQQVREWSLVAYRVLGVRHLCRVDFMVDEFGRSWFIELNTMPGFTTHSLLPMAARQAGLSLARLTDRLVRLAHAGVDVGDVTPG